MLPVGSVSAMDYAVDSALDHGQRSPLPRTILGLTGIAGDVLDAYALGSDDSTMHKMTAISGQVGGFSDLAQSRFIGPESWFNTAWRLEERARRVAESDDIAQVIKNMPAKSRRRLRRVRDRLLFMSILDAGLRATYLTNVVGGTASFAALVGSTILGFARHGKAHKEYKKLLAAAEALSDARKEKEKQEETAPAA